MGAPDDAAAAALETITEERYRDALVSRAVFRNFVEEARHRSDNG